MQYQITLAVETAGDVQGLKEKLAMDFEKYGDVRVLEVRQCAPKNVGWQQMKMGW